MLERDDVVEPHDADVEHRRAGRDDQPQGVERVERRPHLARVDGAQRVPRQEPDDADDEDGENLRGVADQPQQAVPDPGEQAERDRFEVRKLFELSGSLGLHGTNRMLAVVGVHLETDTTIR